MTKLATNAQLRESLSRVSHELGAAREECAAYRAQAIEHKNKVEEVKKKMDAVHAQFDDLKERLMNAELENQRMRGYIQRVQEDDVVREDLVTTGNDEGESQLVPKRKFVRFSEPNNATDFDRSGNALFDAYIRKDRPKPKHWVTY